MGGENSHSTNRADSCGGSSPRGRGKRVCGVGELAANRLIPAWAGKTDSTYRAQSAPGAHPRVGGENRGPPTATRSPKGSSPRGRGKRLFYGVRTGRRGLIPAWAGKTHDWRVLHGGRAAHPRVGGENHEVQAVRAVDPGSSPRGRGKRGGVQHGSWESRLIPAWAGKTNPSCQVVCGRSAHPRVGGENTRS